jgi:hypothetical protein
MRVRSILKHSLQLYIICFVICVLDVLLLDALDSRVIMTNTNAMTGIGIVFLLTWGIFRSFNETYNPLSTAPFFWLSLLFIMSNCVGIGLLYLHVSHWKHVFTLLIQKRELLTCILAIATWLSDLMIAGLPWFISWHSGKALRTALTKQDYLRS